MSRSSDLNWFCFRPLKEYPIMYLNIIFIYVSFPALKVTCYTDCSPISEIILEFNSESRFKMHLEKKKHTLEQNGLKKTDNRKNKKKSYLLDLLDMIFKKS